MNPNWMQIALAEQGQAEVAGGQHNPRIVEYHAATDLRATDDETAWCAAFVSWCLLEAGLSSKRSARALDWASWGVNLDRPVLGALIVGTRPGGGGHAGFYLGQRDGKYLLINGNVGNKVAISTFEPSRVVAIRWPADVPLPNAVAPLAKSGVVRGNLVAAAGTIASLGLGLVESADTVDRAKGWIGEGNAVAIALGVLALAGIVWSIVSRAQGKAQAEAAS